MLLYTGDSLVGRSTQATIRLQDIGVSIEHAVFSISDPSTSLTLSANSLRPEVTIEDLRSAYGTFVEGRRLTPYRVVPLEGTTQLSFGAVHATFHFLESYLNGSD